jgi:hypothetical protein
VRFIAAGALAILIPFSSAAAQSAVTVKQVTVRSAFAHDSSAPLTPGFHTWVLDTRVATTAVTIHESTGPTAAAVEQKAPGTKPAARLVESFDGLGFGFSGPQGMRRGGNPSDNSLAVGPNHIMQTVNGQGLAIFTKKGKQFPTTGKVLYGPVRVNTLFKGFTGNCEERSSGDVVVRYDQLADRWLVVMPLFSRGQTRPDQPAPYTPQDGSRASVVGVSTQPGAAAPLFQPPATFDTVPQPRRQRNQAVEEGRTAQGPQGPYSMCYAVSAGPDPLGTWYRYEFLRPFFPDYPRPAIWPDGYYVPSSTSDNRIADTIATEKHACVVERSKMLEGKPAREQCVILHNMNFLNNVDLDGTKLPPPGAPNIMLAGGARQLDSIFADSVINAWQFHVDWDNPAKTKVTGPVAIPVAPYHYLCNGQLTKCVPQPGTQQRLDSQGDKLMARAVYRRIGDTESIFVTHSINTSNNGGGVRWYEFRVGKDRAVTLHQQGTYLSDGSYRWMGSGAIDKSGNIGMGFSFGSGTEFAGQRFTGRAPNDPLGQMTFAETVLAKGEGVQQGTEPEFRNLRWQDYVQTAVDPVDDCTIWYVGDYYKAGAATYSSKIGAFRMPGCQG